AMAARTGRISQPALRAAARGLERLCEQMDIVEVSSSLVHRAGALAEEHSLRGYGAVHLAAAEALAAEEIVVVTGDGALGQAAHSLGLAVART
ncbi:MAG: type II toxin-antitoxin system VapC family toxin, partial [Mycobacteriales bacterium]